MRLALIVFKLSKDPDFSGQTDWRTDGRTDGQTDGRTEGKPIVPSGVNTGRGLIIILENIEGDRIFRVIENIEEIRYIKKSDKKTAT